jgi:CubicO group peptidase (beta-lactamase class C family)
VARVSGMPFAQFTKQRLFEPLGMGHTSWRDDHTRVVLNRSIAYEERKDGFHTDMPFEDAYGNGGLLTTVGDLLKWNQNFVTPKVGDAAFVTEQQQPGRFNDGRVHSYAFGLTVTSFGTRAVEHSGSTAGYSAHLMRYPDEALSVAVLCNVNTANATQLAHDVADLYLSPGVKAAIKAALPAAPPGLPNAGGGIYRRVDTGVVLTAGRLGDTWQDEGGGRIRVTDPAGTVEIYERVAAVKPSLEQIRDYTGAYTSDEAEATFQAVIDDQSLVLKRRPDTVITLKPLYQDAFDAPRLGLVVFRRDVSGHVNALSVNQDRVWDLRFKRE